MHAQRRGAAFTDKQRQAERATHVDLFAIVVAPATILFAAERNATLATGFASVRLLDAVSGLLRRFMDGALIVQTEGDTQYVHPHSLDAARLLKGWQRLVIELKISAQDSTNACQTRSRKLSIVAPPRSGARRVWGVRRGERGERPPTRRRARRGPGRRRVRRWGR